MFTAISHILSVRVHTMSFFAASQYSYFLCKGEGGGEDQAGATGCESARHFFHESFQAVPRRT